ncbi:MAG: hypothetical protein ACREVB_13625, partial [Burkholderiales bacterium]
IVHLVYHDDAEPDGRLVYTAVAIEDDVVVPATRAFDLRLLAGNAPTVPNALTAPASLRQNPVARRGRDSDNVGIAFVDDERGELVTVELRPIADDLAHFADEARAVVIEIGERNPGSSHSHIADKARAIVIEIGRRCMHPVVGDFLSKAFLDHLAAADPSAALEAAVREALAAHETAVAQYRAGKQQTFGFLVGQVMKAMKGKANPALVNDLVRRLLDEK